MKRKLLAPMFINEYTMNMRFKKHKHFILNEKRIKQAQAILGTKTETETVERALEEVITERVRTKKAWRTQERFLRSRVEIKDVYGLLE